MTDTIQPHLPCDAFEYGINQPPEAGAPQHALWSARWHFSWEKPGQEHLTGQYICELDLGWPLAADRSQLADRRRGHQQAQPRRASGGNSAASRKKGCGMNHARR